MNIKEVSEQTGVSADTIRYYERIGLLPRIKRNPHGVRQFDQEDIRWIVFVRQMRNAGLSIESLIDYLALFKQGEATFDARVDLLVEQKELLQERIDHLEKAKARLAFKIANYQNHVQPTEQQLRRFEEQSPEL